MPLLAGGAVADEAHRIDRFVGRTRGHQRSLARQRARLAEEALDGGDDIHHLGQAAVPHLAAGEIAGAGADLQHAAASQRGDIGLGGGMGPHLQIHRGGDQDRLVGGEQRGRGEIVGQAMRHLGQQIGGGGRHHHQIGVARQIDMRHAVIVVGREQILGHGLAGQGGEGQGGDEALGRRGQQAAHRSAAVAEPADQIETLIGGDAAGDDQQNPLAGQRHRATPKVRKISVLK